MVKKINFKVSDKFKETLYINSILFVFIFVALFLLWCLSLFLVSKGLLDQEVVNKVTPGFILAFLIPILRSSIKKKRN